MEESLTATSHSSPDPAQRRGHRRRRRAAGRWRSARRRSAPAAPTSARARDVDDRRLPVSVARSRARSFASSPRECSSWHQSSRKPCGRRAGCQSATVTASFWDSVLEPDAKIAARRVQGVGVLRGGAPIPHPSNPRVTRQFASRLRGTTRVAPRDADRHRERRIRSAPPSSGARVLAAWTASPARFREDANAEEDLVRGGYRDRLLVELAQNAADAAARAGVPGRLRLELAGETLRAANTGAPLDADGVQGLATLRASAKRDEHASVGRFGVGFAAVLAVSDEPAVVSTAGGVRFSAARTRAEVDALPALAGELERRGGAVPVLRLPWPAAGSRRRPASPPRWSCRCATARGRPSRPRWRSCRRTCCSRCPGSRRSRSSSTGSPAPSRSSGPTATPGSPTTGGRRSGRWPSAPANCPPRCSPTGRSRSGPAARWTVTWAVPLDGDGVPRPLPAGQVVHAPTPSDEPLSLPVRLIAPFPLGPDRRHVAPGAVTDALVAAAADTFADLVTALPADPVLLRLVPRVGLAGAALDAALGAGRPRPAARHGLAPRRGRGDARQLPDRAAALDDATDERVAALTDVLPGLLPAGWSRRSDAPAADRARRPADRDRRGRRGGPRCAAAGVVVGGGSTRPSTAPTARSSRRCPSRSPTAAPHTARPGCCCPTSGLPVAHLGAARAAAGRARGGGAARGPAAARAAGGAAGHARRRPRRPRRPDRGRDVDGGGRGRPRRQRPTRTSWPRPSSPWSPRRGRRVGELPWLAELALPDADGGWAPAGELVLPGSPLAAVLGRRRARACWTPEPAESADPDALRAVGVLDTFAAGARRGPRRPRRGRRRPLGRRGARPAAGRRPAAGVAAADRRP